MRASRTKTDMLRHRSKLGFTLIEVLLVVVITAIITATVMTSFIGVEDDAEEAMIRYSLREMRALVPVWWVKYDIGNGGNLPPSLMKVVPKSPVTGHRYVTIIHTDQPVIPDDVNQSGFGGWLVSSTTLDVWLNSPDYVHY